METVIINGKSEGFLLLLPLVLNSQERIKNSGTHIQYLTRLEISASWRCEVILDLVPASHLKGLVGTNWLDY